MTYDSQVAVDGGDALVRTSLPQFGGYDLLNGKNDAILAPDADGRATVLDGLDGVLDLEVAAIGGEDGVGKIVARAYGRLGGWSN
jgi:hypothetical protein